MSKAMKFYFVLISLVNILAIFYVYDQFAEMRRQIDDVRHVRVEIPKPLADSISADFGHAASALCGDISNSVVRKIESDSKAFRNEALMRVNDTLALMDARIPSNRIDVVIDRVGGFVHSNEARLVAMQSKIDHDLSRNKFAVSNGLENVVSQIQLLRGMISESENRLHVLAGSVKVLTDDVADKSKSYLEAARTQEDVEVKNLLYVAAISAAKTKNPALDEYADWACEDIKRNVQSGNVGSAEERYTAVLNVFNYAMNGASVEDIVAVPQFRAKIDGMAAAIKSYNDSKVIDARKALARIVDRAMTATSSVVCAECRQHLIDLEVPSALDDEKAIAGEGILMRQSCLTRHSDDLIVPPVNERTPWRSWFVNFIARMKSPCSDNEHKLMELAAIGDFYEAARKIADPELSKILNEFDFASATVCVADWKSRVRSFSGSYTTNVANDIAVAKVTELLQEQKNFDRRFDKECTSELVELNSLILKASIGAIDQGLTSFRSIEKDISNENRMQLVASMQGQCIQMIMRVKMLRTDFPEAFDDELRLLQKKSDGFDKLLNSYRLAAKAEDLAEARRQRTAFLEWAKWAIEEAKRYYECGEKIAGQVKYTRGSDVCQSQYRAAWNVLTEIYEADLSMEDPALFSSYNSLKARIEKARPPSDDELKNKTYRRKEDF